METAELFPVGQYQAVRLPEMYRFEGTHVLVKKLGNALVLLPSDTPWQPLVQSLGEFSSDFMVMRDQPDLQKREYLPLDSED